MLSLYTQHLCNCTAHGPIQRRAYRQDAVHEMANLNAVAVKGQAHKSTLKRTYIAGILIVSQQSQVMRKQSSRQTVRCSASCLAPAVAS